jgi:4'-phosphopantetheinyl transferase N-terminal domain
MRNEAPFPVNSSRLLLLERSTSLKRRKPNNSAGRDQLRRRVAPCRWNQERAAFVLAKLLMTTRTLVSATVPCLFVSQIRTHSERFIFQCPLRERRILPLRPSPGTTIFFSTSTSAETTRNNRNPLSEQPTLYSSLSLCSRKLFPRVPVEPAVTALSSMPPKENRATLSYVQELFDMLLPQGQCVGLQFPAELPASQFGLEQSHWLTQFLHPNEIDHGLREYHASAVRDTFYLGRLAMRRALWGQQLQEMKGSTNSLESFWTSHTPFPAMPSNTLEDPGKSVNFRDHCILKDAHGRPTLPLGYVGSISHKNRTAVALVARDKDQGEAATVPTYGIGIDIETIDPRRSRIATKVLTPSEIKQLGRIPVGYKRSAVRFDNAEAAVAHVALIGILFSTIYEFPL